MNPKEPLLDVLSELEEDELLLLRASTIQILIKYNWEIYGKKHFYVVAFFHFLNVILFIVYVN